MLLSRFSKFGFEFTNFPATPVVTGFGTSVVPGASSAEGAWTEIATAANMASHCYWLYLWVSEGATSTASKQHFLDVGIDPAGGTAYTARISDIACGGANGINGVGSCHRFRFPFFIPAGSSVAVRIQGSHATAGTVRVACKMLGQPDRPEQVPLGQYSETLGAGASTLGVSVVPGNAVYGAYATVGTTAKPTFWWNLGVQLDNDVTAAENLYFELSYGDATNKHVITRLLILTTGTEAQGEMIGGNLSESCYAEVPAGSTIYCRALCNNAPDTGYNVTAIGVG